MNGLTDRLQMLADEIRKGETMADIGTDHGFLPLYLWDKGISPQVIMCDISEPSLAKAINAASEYDSDEGLDFRAGDGLIVLKNGEVDDVVIAGMGGLLITEILGEDMAKTKSFHKFVFQPRNHAGSLRYWLASNGFNIISNRLVREGKFICEIITAVPEEVSDAGCIAFACEDDASWDFPEDMYRAQPELAAEYAAVKLGIEEKILDGILKGSTVDAARKETVEKRIEYFKRFVNEV